MSQRRPSGKDRTSCSPSQTIDEQAAPKSTHNENVIVSRKDGSPIAPKQLSTIASLTDPTQLSPLLGPVEHIDRAPLGNGGLSGAQLEHLTIRLKSGEAVHAVLKLVHPTRDWTAYRTDDATGREAMILADAAMAQVWEVFDCPYLAFAAQEETIGLLMDDLTPHVLNEGRLTKEQEDLFLRTFAKLHARFWNADSLRAIWLARPVHRFRILGPGLSATELERPVHQPVLNLALRGWEIALPLLPPSLRARVLQSPEELAARYAHLPQTLLHGDAKVSNVAFLPGNRLAAFDWATVGAGVSTFDLGYFLAVNAARLMHPKEQVISRYRTFLEHELDDRLPDHHWEEMVSAAILGGSLMLLWSKALALESAAPGAREEWEWWIDALTHYA